MLVILIAYRQAMVRRNIAYLLISYPKSKTTEKFGYQEVGNPSPQRLPNFRVFRVFCG
jgi:hypothetical protein